jgi:GNAT superfamily N-acetyltransferase
MNSDNSAIAIRNTTDDRLARSIRMAKRMAPESYYAIHMMLDAKASFTGEGSEEDDGLAIIDLDDPESPEFQKLWLLYNTTFPQDERRSLLEHKLLLNDPRCHFSAIHYEGLAVGLVAHWELHDMIFIEHFAVAPEFRSEGIGGRAIEHLQYYADRKIVLDVEPEEESADACKRVHFYERHGFRYCKKPVVLPTYWFAKPIASNLMVWSPNKANLTHKQIIEDIRRGIYDLAVAR